ncbi:hypothetical protein [Psychrobacter sp. DM4]|uniref:hypothetical protein n=1 Tax=Psychrobacter sp. DM4 TaxID=3440637 RepID=UPI003F4F48C1
MSEIVKHSFEAVSLLTTSNGMLEVTVIPAIDQPDWILPTSLILDIKDYAEYTLHYPWQQQQLPVFHLFVRGQTPSKIIVLEGNTSEHRIALQSTGMPRSLRVRISDVKDIDTPDHYLSPKSNMEKNESDTTLRADSLSSYLYQTVMIEDTAYLIPDIDKMAHYLTNNH